MVVTKYRLDAQPIAKVEKTLHGFLRVQGRLSRTGILEYHHGDGKVTRELRLPDQVFAPESLETARAGTPISVGHPNAQFTPETIRALKVGQTVTDAQPEDGRFLSAWLQIEDQATIEKIESGELKELSAGYLVKLDETPGVWNGQPYDAIQRDIRIEHVALLPKGFGRSGAEVSLRMDSKDSIDIAISREDQMNKLLIDGKEYEVADEVYAAFEAMKAKLPKEEEAKAEDSNAEAKGEASGEESKTEEAKADEAKTDAKDKELGELQVRLDQSEKTVKELMAQLEAVKADAANKIRLIDQARPFLATDYDFYGNSIRKIQSDVLAATTGTKVDEQRSDGWVEGAFEMALKTRRDADQSIKNLVVPSIKKVDAEDETHEPDPEKARSERIARLGDYNKVRGLTK